jgi:TetR/AcrR family transcriptional regulator
MAMTFSVDEANAQKRRLERKERRHESRRRAILDSAREILAREGIQNFSVNGVARAADVSKPAVYYYFESKEELIFELAVDAELEEACKIQEALRDEQHGMGVLEVMLKAYVAHYLSDLDRFRLRYVWPQVLGISSRLLEAESHRRSSEVDALVSKRLERERAQGRLRPGVDATQLTRLTRVLAHGLVAQACHAASASGDAKLEVLELCQTACGQLQRYGA